MMSLDNHEKQDDVQKSSFPNRNFSTENCLTCSKVRSFVLTNRLMSRNEQKKLLICK